MENKEIDKYFNYGNDYFDVERIITRKYKGDKKYYLIKWEGYPLKDCSWEPATNLENIKIMVENFDNNYPNSIKKRLLKKYFRLIHGNKRNKNKLKKYSQKKDNFNNNNLIIRIHNSMSFSIEENMKEKEEKYKEINAPINRYDKKEDEEYKQEILVKSNDEKKYEDSIVNKSDINLNKIEKESIDNKDVPKLIRPIIIW
jgi:hypothetical protein